MAIKYVCDKCESAFRTPEDLTEVVDIDLCYRCYNEFEDFFYLWIDTREVKVREKNDYLDKQIKEILCKSRGAFTGEEDTITQLRQFMTAQFLEMLPRKKQWDSNGHNYMDGWNDCLEELNK